MPPTRTFSPKHLHIRIHLAFGILLLLVPVGVVLKLTFDGASAHSVYLAVLLIFFLVAAIGLKKTWSQRKSGITVSDQGLWPAHLDRASSLVPWQKVARVRELPRARVLELRDAEGRRLLDLSLDLVDFDQLQELVADQLANNAPAPRLPARFDQGWLEYLALVATPAAALAAVGYFFWSRPFNYFFLAFAVLMMAVGLKQIWDAVLWLEVENGSLTLGKVFGNRRIHREEIAGLKAGRHINLYPQVSLQLKDGSRFDVRLSTIEATELKAFLESWRRRDRRS